LLVSVLLDSVLLVPTPAPLPGRHPDVVVGGGRSGPDPSEPLPNRASCA